MLLFSSEGVLIFKIDKFVFSEQVFFFFFFPRSGQLTSAETVPLKMKRQDLTLALSSTTRYLPEKTFQAQLPSVRT